MFWGFQRQAVPNSSQTEAALCCVSCCHLAMLMPQFHACWNIQFMDWSCLLFAKMLSKLGMRTSDFLLSTTGSGAQADCDSIQSRASRARNLGKNFCWHLGGAGAGLLAIFSRDRWDLFSGWARQKNPANLLALHVFGAGQSLHASLVHIQSNVPRFLVCQGLRSRSLEAMQGLLSGKLDGK